MSWIFLESSVLLTQVFFKIPFYGILWGCTHVLCGSPTCWMKKNDVAKMRQAGTAPATGTTIYCPTSLWCTVTYKLLALCTANTLLRVSVRLVLRSDLCRIYCAIYGCIRNSEFRSKCVTLLVRVRSSSCVTGEVRVDLNGSKFKCHLDEYGAACTLNYGSTEGYQVCAS